MSTPRARLVLDPRDDVEVVPACKLRVVVRVNYRLLLTQYRSCSGRADAGHGQNFTWVSRESQNPEIAETFDTVIRAVAHPRGSY